MAEYLRVWLKDVIHIVEPWVSSEDIRSGSRWVIDVASRLEGASFGILCLTKENVLEPWVLFEAGALSRSVDKSRVCPYLLDLAPTDLKGPLDQFQAIRAVESETKKLVVSLNEALGVSALPSDLIDRSFARLWPELEAKLKDLPAVTLAKPERRSERDLLEELLERVRRIDMKEGHTPPFEPDSFLASMPNLFDGDDVYDLLRAVDRRSHDEDEDAPDGVWGNAPLDAVDHELDGIWSMRWVGGTSRGRWIYGVAVIKIFDSRFYAITHDGKTDCLAVAKLLAGNRLAGRHINLKAPTEILPWAGAIVSTDRIDAIWEGGQWDFRRLAL